MICERQQVQYTGAFVFCCCTAAALTASFCGLGFSPLLLRFSGGTTVPPNVSSTGERQTRGPSGAEGGLAA